MPKETYIYELQASIEVFPKIVFCTGAVGCQIFVQYIRMLCPGRFILVESVVPMKGKKGVDFQFPTRICIF